MKTFLIKSMFFISFAFTCTFHSKSEIVKKVASGATSIDVSINSSIVGTFYYTLFAKNQGSLSAESVKLSALSPLTTVKVKGGTVSINANDLNLDQTRLIGNLTQDSSFYFYGVFEDYKHTLGNVEYYPIFLPSRQPAFNYTSTVTGQSGTTVRYLLYKPESALKKTDKPQPILLFFHGDSEKGTDINLVKRNGPPKLIDEGKDFDFIVASPQVNWPIVWDRPGFLEEFVSKLEQTINIDTNRIYISAISGGGGGLYYYLKNYPSKVTAVVPVSAVNNMYNYCDVKNVAFWGFHNLYDNVVGIGNLKNVVSGINSCIPKPLVPPIMTIYSVTGHDSWTLAYATDELYPWLTSKTKNDRLNTPPIVNAGDDLNVGSNVTLSGYAADNQFIISYLWEQKTGPEATIINQESPLAILKDLSAGTYIFKLTATDNSGATATDEITINATGAVLPNQLPIVSAGKDLVKTITTNPITITGSASDPDGVIINYSWQKISGSDISLLNSTTLSLIVLGTISGDYTFRLTVTDNNGATAFDEVNLKLNDSILSIPVITVVGSGLSSQYYNNTSLIGTALISKVDSTINFSWGNGSPSTLINTDYFSACWEGQIESPISGQIRFSTISDDGVKLWIDDILVINNWTNHAPTTNYATVTLSGAQKYNIKLAYYEAYGGSTIKLMWEYSGQSIQPVPKNRLYPFANTTAGIVNQNPIVNAGQDITVFVTATGITLSGIASDPDGSISNYQWTKIVGPDITMSVSTLSSLILSNLVTGNFVFRLSVTDDKNAIAFDDININVLPVYNQISVQSTFLGNGLKASYFNNTSLLGSPVFSRTDTTINFSWGLGSPNPLVNIDNFSARWEGQILAPVSGQYTFSTTSDDGIRIWVNNQMIINSWANQYNAVTKAAITLEELIKYDIIVEYYEGTGGALAKLSWSFPGTSMQIIPKSKFFSTLLGSRLEYISNEAENWAVYPNPVTDIIYIGNLNSCINAEINLYNLLGELVYHSVSTTEEPNNKIDIKGFYSGIYFLIISNEGKHTCQKIIIK